ncbi:MAG TPA: class I SAM-dependent methyltransferase [Solirubrobacteraceae bacterium]|jgi:SAM-dependent methyltransferase|nr:class I SAM-dependent methyltransferase [Solirubrobacteraceae bacterium]
MSSRAYHEAIWQAVAEGSQPRDLALRRTFLLSGLRAAATRQGAGGPPGDGAPQGAGAPLRVLDVGCGEGQLTAAVARAGHAVVGVDVAEEPLRRARAQHAGLDLRLLDIDGEWPFADASFDAVWAGETIEHVADTAGWLSQLRRVLRSGGSLLASTPAHGRLRMLALALSARATDEHFDPRSDHLRFYTRRTLAGLLAEFGFERIDVRAAGGPPGARRQLLASALRSRF